MPILSQESKSALMSDLPLIVTAEPNFRIRLTESWSLHIDTEEYLDLLHLAMYM